MPLISQSYFIAPESLPAPVKTLRLETASLSNFTLDSLGVLAETGGGFVPGYGDLLDTSAGEYVRTVDTVADTSGVFQQVVTLLDYGGAALLVIEAEDKDAASRGAVNAASEGDSGSVVGYVDSSESPAENPITAPTEEQQSDQPVVTENADGTVSVSDSGQSLTDLAIEAGYFNDKSDYD